MLTRFACIIFLLTIHTACISQQNMGIYFEKGLSWTAVQQKAKKENKFIFLDAYTTWCIPCRKMASTIFPQPAVGDFFNKNFINVAVQMDETEKDDKNIKLWYHDAQIIADVYKIEAYPTYLFFNSNGILVHAVEGSSNDANNFIAKAKRAFDPNTQYLAMKNAYKRGRRDSAFLFAFINTAKDANDDSLAIFINDYLHTQTNLLTQQSISLQALGTEYITDTGLYIFMHHPAEVNKVLGKSQRLNLVCKIVFNDQLYPLISYNGKITHTGGMTMYHEDSLRRDVNWVAMEAEMISKYKELGEPITVNARLNYDEWRHDWTDYNTCLSGYTSGNDLDLEFINTKAWNFATYCEDKPLLKAAIKWSSILVKKDPETYYFLTYSRLLYKAGEPDMAIEQLKQYITRLKAPDEYASAMMEKMQKGEKIE